MKNGDIAVYKALDQLFINYQYYEHPPVPTIEEAKKHWKDIDAAHCKNLFFRNHKGNKHYLVVFHYLQNLDIKSLELSFKQGKISFASEWRLHKYLKIRPGSLSPFGLIHDIDNHVKLFLDIELRKYESISFHPNENTASIVLSLEDFDRYLEFTGNDFEWIKLY